RRLSGKRRPPPRHGRGRRKAAATEDYKGRAGRKAAAKERGSGIGDDFDEHGALARTVEFAKEDSLPGAEREFAIFDEDGLTRSSENRFHVGISIAFGVLIGTLLRDEAIKNCFNIGCYIGVGMFVDGYACGGVRNVNVTEASFYAGFADRLFDFMCNVEKLSSPSAFDAKGFHVRRSYGMGMMKCEPIFLVPEWRSISSKPCWPQRAAKGRKQSWRDCRFFSG